MSGRLVFRCLLFALPTLLGVILDGSDVSKHAGKSDQLNTLAKAP
jgi:hypothetical protein